ncbi:phosphoethanolamine transferase [Xylanibacter brevis]|uniref:phosphoethanolamine transferase n=1 Tax=Xylanibacter brevis TaxID=83231 RepID=UPI0009DD0670|nr:phosphoethanolamine transferase [Xylanibacter brevis]
MKSLTLLVTTLTACLLCVNPAGGLSVIYISSSLFTALLISGLLSLIPSKKVGYMIMLVVGELVLACCLVDCFCQEVFASPITPHIMSNIMLSNLREMHEFIFTFIGVGLLSHWRIACLLALMALMPVFLLFQYRYEEQFPWHRYVNYAYALLFSVCFAFCAVPTYRYMQLFFQQHDYQRMEGLMLRGHHEEMATPLHRLLFAYYSTKVSSRILAQLKSSTIQAKIDSCSYKSPHIVLVIGESYNKHHSSLYGYTLPTTPLQQKRCDKGELFVFNDVVSPWNITSNAILGLFSLWEYGMQDQLEEKPLVPILFRQAGYEVSFFSNQYLIGGFLSGHTNKTGHFFLSDPELSHALFTHRNSKANVYDMELLEQVKAYKTEHASSAPTLDFIHLIGQHFDYSKRYPKQMAVFSHLHYSDRRLGKDAVETVMHYDNATRYNDNVLDKVIAMYSDEEALVIFVSDHGEEVFDEPSVGGRHFKTPTALEARNEYEVPMWIWCSAAYMEKHADVVKSIKQSVNKPFLTDGMPQLLLSLAGISCEWLDDDRNILSEKYKCKPRIIAGSVDYDMLPF